MGARVGAGEEEGAGQIAAAPAGAGFPLPMGTARFEAIVVGEGVVGDAGYGKKAVPRAQA